MKSEPAPVIRMLGPSDVDEYSAVHLAGLVEFPAAFTTDADAWRDAPRDTIARHLAPDRAETRGPVLGAWRGEELVGLIGLTREERRSVAHKAGLWGFYVTAGNRRRGVGRRLLSAMIDHAAGMPGLRQLRAVVAASCVEALALFESDGFERFGFEQEARLVDGRFHDLLYLWYRLPGDADVHVPMLD